jgi:multimeric flavodoxin WrbA
MKRMLLINGSPRNNGSSSGMLNMISERSPDYECETINLSERKISHCKGCLSCKTSGECSADDDMRPLYRKIQDADAIAIAVPVYFGGETGLLKNFIDRLYALMDRKDDGSWNVRFGKRKKGIVAIPCGAPDGNMIYHGMMTHMTVILRMFGASDVASGIIPSASPETLADSQFTKDLMGACDFVM